MVMIGIDLGTTNSLAVAFVEGQVVLIPNVFGEYLTPSVVHVSDGQLTVGKLAKERLVTHPKQTVQLFKRLMGSADKVMLDGTSYSAIDLSAMVVKQLMADAQEFLGEAVDEVIISVPAYFNEQQRQATKAIGAKLGVKVERLINEPSAAAIACHEFGTYETFIVFDFGGGTLDVSVVDCFENVVSISAIAGDNQLGGSDFDQALANYFCDVHGLSMSDLAPQARHSLLLAAERCKLALQEQETAYLSLTIDGDTLAIKVTQTLLKQLLRPILEKVKAVIARAVRESGFGVDEFDSFILVGGSSQMPLVQEFLKETLNLPVKGQEGMDELVAKGLGTYLGIKSRADAVKSLVVTDVCPFSLGIDTYDEKFDMLRFAKIIPKNTVLPTSASSYFSTMRLGQKEIRISVFQGESLTPESNLFLGQASVPVPINHEKHEQIKVTFSYDLNALLYVEVTVLSTGETMVYRLGKDKKLVPVTATAHLEDLKDLSLNLTREPEFEAQMARAYRLYEELPIKYQKLLEEDIIYVRQHYHQTSNNLKKRQLLILGFGRKLDQFDQVLLGLEQRVFKELDDKDED